MKKLLLAAASTLALAFGASGAMAEGCDDGEVVIKFSHDVAETHPKGVAAKALGRARVNKEMDGKACMEIYPNSTLYDDNKVMEAMLLGDVQLGRAILVQVRSLYQEVPPVRSAVPVWQSGVSEQVL